MARAIETGVLSINSNTSVRVSTPFGGFKQSGYGRELGPHALEHYSEIEDRLLRDRGPLMAGRLAGKVCVITGASGGIGAASAEAVRAPRARASSASTWREGAPGELSLQVDVTDDAAVRDMYARVRDELGRVDVLFNNAGISPTDDGSVLDTSLEAWQRVQDVNLKSVFLCCKHGIPHLLDGRRRLGDQHRVVRRGRWAPRRRRSPTRASKGAVLSLSRELGVQFARQGVRVNALCPGPVDTPLLRELFAKDPVAAARRLVHVPMGRFARARGDRVGGAVPRERRVVVRRPPRRSSSTAGSAAPT